MIEALLDLGFEQYDAQVYVFLALNGAHKASHIAETMRIYKRQIYHSLSRLQKKGLIRINADHPALFSTTPFEIVLDRLTNIKVEQAKALQASKKELLSSWREVIEEDSPDS